ncbi:hypothetical protein [Catellatospora tritici]|uniref:hypothetical protein n=1 Tax=Catellatospora tritici TaxID=2851566 RepID=UPI001C2CD049|nr:hypothetical protein [Catellatospora tritici]MBV1854533.1 hypothetical protein [Catellatospora tritici]
MTSTNSSTADHPKREQEQTPSGTPTPQVRQADQSSAEDLASKPSAASHPDALAIELPDHDPLLTTQAASALFRLIRNLSHSRAHPVDHQQENT